MTVKPDILWKVAFRNFMPQFVEFFYPERYNEIDWTKAILFLDKELQTIQPESRPKDRIADVLVMFHLKNGEPIWILLHIEIQGYIDAFFGQRVHQIRYRVEDKLGANPAMLCIFTDDDPDFHPKEYYLETWGASTRTIFNTYKVMENAPKGYKNSSNIVSYIMEVVYQSTQMKQKSDYDVMKLFIPVAKNLFSKGCTKTEIDVVLAFIESHVKFKKTNHYSMFKETLEEMRVAEDIDQIVADFHSNPQSSLVLQIREADKRREEYLQLKEAIKQERELVELEHKKVEQEREKAEKEREKAEKEREKAEKEREKAERSVLLMINQGIGTDLISRVLGISIEQITSIQEIYKDDNFLDNLN